MLLFAGCDRLTPNGELGTMALLRSGSEKVCVASDVQDALRTLILPKPAEVSAGNTTEEKLNAIHTVSFSYDLTTLQSFDQAVSRASCNTTVRLSGSGGKSDKFQVNYQVSPSAETGGSFIVTADADGAKAFASGLIDDAIAEEGAKRDQDYRVREESDRHDKLMAVITPKWLVGTWIAASADASACASGDTMSFQANHVYEGRLFTGRWSLTGDQLHRVGSGSGGGGDETDTITAADPISFDMQKPDGGSSSFRRCTRDEVAAQSGTATDPGTETEQ